MWDEDEPKGGLEEPLNVRSHPCCVFAPRRMLYLEQGKRAMISSYAFVVAFACLPAPVSDAGLICSPFALPFA